MRIQQNNGEWVEIPGVISVTMNGYQPITDDGYIPWRPNPYPDAIDVPFRVVEQESAMAIRRDEP